MLLLVILLILIATVITCFTFLRKEKEWLAFYIACCGGVLTVNLILSIILVNKNFGDKRRP
jgi:Na+/citrate or Na+/malate symporter